MAERKSLQELTIKDNFMFGAVMLNPDICREVIERVLGIPIERVEVDREKSIVYHPKYKGVRLDAYAKDEHNTRYSVEMQVKLQKDLRKRARYYQSQMDMDILLTGVKYENLPNTYVIFICDFDPFGMGKYCYTELKVCKECSELSLDDGAHKIFLSTKGTNKDEVAPELLKFLEFVETPTDDEVDNEDTFVRKLKESVKKVKVDREMGARYMTLEDLIREEREEAVNENLLAKINKKLEKGQSVEQIAEDLVEDVDTIQRLLDEISQ